MSSLVTTFEEEILNVYFRNQARTYFAGGAAVGGTVYVALSSAAYSEAATGTVMNELAVANGYARASVPFTTAPAGSPRAIDNTTAVTFSCTGSAWTTVQSMYICDASTSGKVLCGATLTGGSVTLNPGDQLTFAIGDIDISLQ